MIDPTNKLSAKMSCLAACDGDVARARELYEFIVDGMDIPDMPLMKKSAFVQIKETAQDLFGWVDQNQDKLIQGYNFIQSIRNGTPISPSAPNTSEIPPIPSE